MDHNYNIKYLKLVLTGLHASAIVFGVLVFCLAAATIAESNKAVAAVRNATWSYYGWSDNAYWVVGAAPFLGFTMFVSITGFLLSAFLATCYLKPHVYDKTLGVLAAKSPSWAKWPFYELVISVIWTIFWLAAAGVASDSPFIRLAGWYCSGSSCGQFSAVVAFSWLSWFVWLAVVVLLAVECCMAARKVRSVAVAADPATAAKAAEGKEAKPADIEMGKAAEAGQGKEVVTVTEAEGKQEAEAAAAAGPNP